MLKHRILQLGAAIALLGASACSTATAATATLQAHFIDIGQGDAIYIKTANGDDILIDGGGKGKGDEVVAYLKKQKVDDIEVMISTHPDADHIGGLDEVLAFYKVEAVYAPKVSSTTQAYKDFLTAVKNEGLKMKTVTAGLTIPLKGVTAKFVGPVKAYSESDTNDWSAVLKLTYNKNSFLFTGDAELKAEKDMLASKQDLKADVLKVGHHGSNNSSSKEFLAAVKPAYSIISVGKNSYGHPTNEVLQRLAAVKSKVYRTDLKGSIVVTSTGTSLSVKTER